MRFYRWHRGVGVLVLALAGVLLCMPPAGAAEEAVTGRAARDREGALGLVLSHGPEYPGAERSSWGWKPAFYLRWGRWSVSNAAGFVNRRSDAVPLGLGIDLVEHDDFSASLGLRVDRGRSESASDALRGTGDTPSTVRMRLAGTWRRDDGWRVHGSCSVDALGRGAGWLADLGASREHAVGEAALLSWGGSLSYAGSRYQRVYYGIDAAQAARSGYAVYRPGAGLRDAKLFANLRSPLGPHRSAMAGIELTRQIGPAADSPLVRQPLGWGASAGLAWQF